MRQAASKFSMSGSYHTLCSLDQIPDGQARAFSVGELRIGLFHVDGQCYALEDPCPHAGASLSLGNVEDDVVRCRIHHWGFSLRDGVCVDQPRPGCNARSFPVRVVDGEVQVRIAGDG